ncbi:MAG TPA: ABC transporter substrate-binding protein [Dongiaceae bacterium]|jgi:phospholipid transport system substrate-binding protein|nr:ABC transporter substrate-binding protein [Dongiaceae bacterium]
MSMLARRKVLAMAGGAIMLAALTRLGRAAAGDPKQVVQNFYDALLASMKAPDFAARFAILSPVIQASFDITVMTKITIGPAWTDLPADKKNRAIATFGKYIITSYASRFRDYSGQQFIIDRETVNPDRALVYSRMTRPKEEDIQFNYVLHANSEGWRIVDIYLGGSISEMARLRSEFSDVLAHQGIDALDAQIGTKTEELMKPAK